jgi:hypothetical protein
MNRGGGLVEHKDLEDKASVVCRLFVCLFVCPSGSTSTALTPDMPIVGPFFFYGKNNVLKFPPKCFLTM